MIRTATLIRDLHPIAYNHAWRTKRIILADGQDDIKFSQIRQYVFTRNVWNEHAWHIKIYILVEISA